MSAEIEALLQEVGYLMAKAVGGDPDGAFLYAEAEPGALSWSLFIDRGEHVDYFYKDTEMDDALFALRRAAGRGKAWDGVSYAIVQDSMDVQFYYADDWDADEFYPQRRERILAARYGSKPIKYPPTPLTATRL